MAKILDGRAAAEALRARLRSRVEALAARGVVPGLVLLRVGDDPASVTYVRGKEKASRELGIASRTVVFPSDAPPARVEEEIVRLNDDSSVHGILLQLPLPAHLPEEELLSRIHPEKDVDGFHPVNAGRLCLGLPGFVAATPLGVLRLLQHYEIPVAGRRVVILGRSRIVGRPLANLLSQKGDAGDATVTMCHSRSRGIAEIAREGEILVAAIGRKRWVGAEMVGDGAVVIDVGIHSEPDPARPGKSRLCGDVDFDAVEPKASAITPVPGGIGPMTVACLLENTVRAAEAAREAAGLA
ncbi:MAG: bifunctional 5,10-methylene-tetrahydrofolate dehydrogenase/5,10-methylene-tetrahydrofolate cyclohydrolase [Candidatus Eisenbacteria bacterium]|nr:bifunctional 5,10-methylene-tetrahydrofolate dehydrogenase/5,10-methylene-tetrahydrofolate cyclohydrolase [Candidatus Eisenbacteria bacterium]